MLESSHIAMFTRGHEHEWKQLLKATLKYPYYYTEKYFKQELYRVLCYNFIKYVMQLG